MLDLVNQPQGYTTMATTSLPSLILPTTTTMTAHGFDNNDQLNTLLAHLLSVINHHQDTPSSTTSSTSSGTTVPRKRICLGGTRSCFTPWKPPTKGSPSGRTECSAQHEPTLQSTLKATPRRAVRARAPAAPARDDCVRLALDSAEAILALETRFRRGKAAPRYGEGGARLCDNPLCTSQGGQRLANRKGRTYRDEVCPHVRTCSSCYAYQRRLRKRMYGTGF